jgi:hypothetical protein
MSFFDPAPDKRVSVQTSKETVECSKKRNEKAAGKVDPRKLSRGFSLGQNIPKVE